MKNINNAVDGRGLANNYDRQIQRRTNFRSTFVMLKLKLRDNEFCDVTLASVNGQRFKAHKVILSFIHFRSAIVKCMLFHDGNGIVGVVVVVGMMGWYYR